MTCLSAFHLQKLQENTAVSAEIIPWGIEEIKSPNIEKTIDLIFCGWINELKNYNQFIDIVNILNKKNKLKKVVICGGGSDIDKLKRKINLLSLESLIEVTGEIGRQNVLLYISKSKILVHTSNFESFGLVLAEALAYKCYVVAKPVGIAYDEQLITKCNSTNEFVHAIEKNLNNTQPVELAAGKYSIQKTVDKYLKLYSFFFLSLLYISTCFD